MKKLLVLLLVLGLVSVTNASIVKVTTDDVGSATHTGLTSGSRLNDGETINLKIMLNWNPEIAYYSYALSSMDFTLHADGTSTIAVVPTKVVKFDASLGGGTAVTDTTGFSKITAVSLSGTSATSSAGVKLVYNLQLTAKGSTSGLINVNLGLRALSEYREGLYVYPGGNEDAWLAMVEGDLGDLQAICSTDSGTNDHCFARSWRFVTASS